MASRNPANRRLQLSLLGGFRAMRDDGELLSITSRKARALLAFLAVFPGRAYPREHLRSLLWSEVGDRQARDSLRQALAALRRPSVA